MAAKKKNLRRRNPSSTALSHAATAKSKAHEALVCLREAVNSLTEAYIESSELGFTRKVTPILTKLNSLIQAIDANRTGILDAIEKYEGEIEDQM